MNLWIADNPGILLSQNILDYFDSCHENGYATSSLWSAASVLKLYFKIKSSFNLDDQIPLLARKFNYAFNISLNNCQNFNLITTSPNSTGSVQVPSVVSTVEPAAAGDSDVEPHKNE